MLCPFTPLRCLNCPETRRRRRESYRDTQILNNYLTDYKASWSGALGLDTSLELLGHKDVHA